MPYTVQPMPRSHGAGNSWQACMSALRLCRAGMAPRDKDVQAWEREREREREREGGRGRNKSKQKKEQEKEPLKKPRSSMRVGCSDMMLLSSLHTFPGPRR